MEYSHLRPRLPLGNLIPEEYAAKLFPALPYSLNFHGFLLKKQIEGNINVKLQKRCKYPLEQTIFTSIIITTTCIIYQRLQLWQYRPLFFISLVFAPALQSRKDLGSRFPKSLLILLSEGLIP